MRLRWTIQQQYKNTAKQIRAGTVAFTALYYNGACPGWGMSAC
jgi:hypothetical protein